MGKKVHVNEKAVQDAGFRSKFEWIVNTQLQAKGVTYQYEGDTNTIYYVEPAKVKRYVADFLLSNGVIIEAKGFFDADDRKKHLLIKSQFPQLDIRFLFMSSKNKLSKRSTTTYAQWCDKHGFVYADMTVPTSWCKLTKSEEELQKIFGTLSKMCAAFAELNYKESCDGE